MIGITVLKIIFLSESLLTSSLAQRYSFCSDKKEYAFSAEACPGGVLLKESMKIDESCYCFGSDLKVVQSCGPSNNHTSSLIGHSLTLCSKASTSDKIKFTGARLLLPLRSKSTITDSEYCPSLPSSCEHLQENQVLESPGIVLNEITDFGFNPVTKQLGRKVRIPRSISNSKSSFKYRRDSPPDESSPMDEPSQSNSQTKEKPSSAGVESKVPTREEALKLLQLVQNIEEQKTLSGSLSGVEDSLNIFKIMRKVVEMFKTLASDLVMRDDMTDAVYEIFKGQMNMDYEYNDLLKIDQTIGDDMVTYILQGLEQCHGKHDASPFAEYEFEKLDGCPATVGAFYHPKRKIHIPLSDFNMPAEYSYVPDKEDLVLGFLWKAIDAVHAECYGFWQDNYDGTLPFYFFTFMENFFNFRQINEKFYSKDGLGTTQYEALLESDRPFSILMENVDILVKAIHYRSRFLGYFHKPKKMEEAMSDGTRKRKKRNENSGLDAFEIWGGRAYCLQKMDPIQPPGFSNSFPKIEYLCKA